MALFLLESAGPALASDLHRGLPLNVLPERSALYDLKSSNGTLLAVGELGLVMRSEDNGRSWSSHYASTDRTLTSIEIINDELLLAVGHGGTIVRSEDGAQHWQKIEVTDAGLDSFLGIVRLASGRLLAYGAYGMYFTSDDGGVNWSRRYVFNEEFDWHITGITEQAGRIYLVGESGTLGVSEDEGQTWNELNSPYNASLFGVLALKGGVTRVWHAGSCFPVR